MSFLAPYTNAMRLGQGFNSYTQEICIDDAVIVYSSDAPEFSQGRDTAKSAANVTISTILPSKDLVDTPINQLRPLKVNFTPPTTITEGKLASSTPTTATQPAPASATADVIGTAMINPKPTSRTLTFSTTQGDHVNQIVTFNSRSIENVSDVLDSLNVSTSASIKYGTVKAGGNASFVNEHKINDSDLNYLVTVKVTNEYEPPPLKMEFLSIDGMPVDQFTDIYGDCFIAGFLEGGEFNAIISIKVLKKENMKKVKLAAELSLNVGPSPVAVGASASTDKEHTDDWSDTETTISVSWCGGGEIKKKDTKWSLSEVINAANDFPNAVAQYSQRISAILMDYRSLRSFHIANFKQIKENGKPFAIADYDLCSVYTTDLFASYMSFKRIANYVQNVLKEPRAYKALQKSKDVPEPIQTDGVSLNGALSDCRKGMTLVLQEIKRLESDPSITIDEQGNMRKLPFKFPAEIQDRLPRYVGPPPEDLLSRLDPTSLSSTELAAIAKYANNPDLSFSALVGDPTTEKSSKPFCSLNATASADLDNIVSIRVHGHKHRHLDILGDWHHFSKTSERSIAAIGFTTSRDHQSGKQKPACGCYNHVGTSKYDHLCTEDTYLSRLADLSSHNSHLSNGNTNGNSSILSGGVTKVSITYAPSDRRIAGFKLFGPGSIQLLTWDMYDGKPATERPGNLVEITQTPPVEEDMGGLDEKRVRWILAGVWGTGDLVVNRLGAIWKKE